MDGLNVKYDAAQVYRTLMFDGLSFLTKDDLLGVLESTSKLPAITPSISTNDREKITELLQEAIKILQG